MNKNLYRIVFNKARGLLMVVADIAGAGRAGISSSPSGIGHTLSQLTGKVNGVSFALLLALGAIQPVQAAIVADGRAPGHQQPTIINSANGTPQVNIQTPSAAGVSRNVYSQFDVDKKGVVLNNSHTNTRTQIAGMVNGNPWLAKGEAKIILNEVNARNPSQLNGFIEVAGQKAQVVIANPSGITCNGCGFINANRATLTTGQVQMSHGQLTGYNVDRGEIVIQGNGLDSHLPDSTDLISRAIKVNAGIWANELNVTTGRNQVDATHQRIDKKTDNGTARPQLAVDVSQLGGMYANRIRLLGTESGVGVYNAGVLGALAGDVVVNADGTLTNSGAINASQNIRLMTSAAVDNRGTVYATGNTDITSHTGLSNAGLIAASEDTRISAGSIHSGAQSVLAAGVAGDGKLASSGNLTLTSRGELKASGQNIAGGQLSARATSVDFSGSQTYGNSIALQASHGDISTANANLSATHQLTVSTEGMLSNDGGKIAAGQLKLTANRLSNQQGMVQHLGQQDLQLTYTGGINNRQGTLASNSNNLTLSTPALNNQQGTIFHAGDGQLTINVGQLAGAQGTLVSNSALNLSGSALNLDNAVTQAAGITLNADTVSHHFGQMAQHDSGLMTLNVTGLFDNTNGALTSKGALSLNAAQLNNPQGRLIAGEQTIQQLMPGGTLNNRTGIIAAGGDLTSLSNTVDNRGGLIQSGAELIIDSRGEALLNTDSGTEGGIISAGRMQLATGDIDNHNGQIAAQSLTATTGNVNNQAGKLLADNAMVLSGGALNNQGGVLQSADVLTLNTHGQHINNTSSGRIIAAGGLSVDSGDLHNHSGKIVSGGDTSLQTSLFNNNDGQLSALGDLSLTSHGLQNNDGGLIQSARHLLIDTRGAALSNNRSGSTGGITSQGDLTIKAAALDNQQGVMMGNGQMALSTEDVNNQRGQIVALGDIVAMSHALDNQWGTLQSGQKLQWNTQDFALTNPGGTLSAQDTLTLDSASLNNQQGLLASGDTMLINTGVFDNSQQGHIASKGALSLTTESINNQQGQIQSLGEMVLSAVPMIDNGAGLIQGAANVALNAIQVLNQHTRAAGLGIQGNTLTLNATDLDNSHGQMLADDGLKLNLNGVLNNNSGLLSSQNTLDAQAQQIINSAGDVEAGKLIRLSGDAMSGDGKLLSLGDLRLNLAQDFLNTGSLRANNNLSLTTQGNLTNQSLIQAGNDLRLSASNIVNGSAAEINAGTTRVDAAQTVTNYGLIDGIYTRIAGQTVSNIASGRIYGDVLAIGAGTLNNLAKDGQAATLAARQRLDIGATTINNRDHALIYSDGLMAVGAVLNGNYQATGQGGTLNNHSATLESAGNMVLNIASINNNNDHFSLENVLVSQEAISEYTVSRLNNGVRYNDKDYTIYIYQNEVNTLCIEGVICHTTDGDRFTHYAYTRTITEDRVKETDPAKIIAGGSLSINANDLLNDKSQIVAGDALVLQGTTVNNVETEASRQTNDVGKAIFYSRHQNKGGDSSKVDTSDYVPPTVIQAITLRPGTVQEYSQAEGSGLNLSDRQSDDINVNIQKAGSLNILPDSPPNAGHLITVIPGAVTLPAGKTFEVKTGDSGTIVRAIGPDTRLPDNSLFHTLPESTRPYLVETDPRFTDQKKWLGSDYMMDAFTHNADNILKRLGDGYYEQRLIREQIIALTGQRYLKGAKSDEEQYKALMNEGIAFGQKYNLTPGVALTAGQMNNLTSDMVWMVAQTVYLADGSPQQVLVPQVYAMVQAGDVDGSGALLAGKNVSLNLSGDLTNSGRITGQQNTQIFADNINNLSGFIRGNDVTVQARTDINNVGGLLSGNQNLSVLAGRDINALTTTRNAESAGGDFARLTLDRVAGFYLQQPEGLLALQAGRDISLTGAQVINQGDGGTTAVIAGRDLNLNTVTTGSTDNLNWGDNWLHQSTRQQTGSGVTGAGDLHIAAGNSVNVIAGHISAGQQLNVAAGNDINLQHSTDTETFDQHYKATGSSSLLSQTTTEQRDTFSHQAVNGSLLSGDSVNLQAGHDLSVTGSNIVATQDVNLAADNNLNILAAISEQQESHLYSEKTSGISGTGGIGVSIGTHSLKITDDGKTRSSTGSTVGSTQGSVNLSAGNGLTVKGSDLLTGKDLNLTGKEVNILASEHQSSQTHRVEQKQSGLTLALSGTVGSAINTAVSIANDASTESSGRLSALLGVKSALSGVQAAQAISLAETGRSESNVIGLNLSYGSQSSSSTQTSTQHQSQGSTLTAGNHLTINATGADINLQGSQLQAGKNVGLSAARDVTLFSALEGQTLEGKNESQGASVGVGINFGQGANGLSLNASVNKGKGSETGNGTGHVETTVNAGNNLTISSGRDTTLTGAQVSGGKVTMDTGRHLTLTSEQDTDNYDARQQNASAGGSVSMNGGSATVSLSQDNMHSTYESVQEQTGIFAGNGGFDITVGEHTQLHGAVIGSTADTSLNRLDTGTLGFSDIQNSAEYDAEHQSVGISTGGNIGGQFVGNMANSLLAGVNGSGSDSSTTKSAVSEGTITLRDKDNQKQDVGELSRDVEHANQTLSPIFDKEKEQNRLKEAQLIGEIGNQTMDIARTRGEIIATKAANEKIKNVSPDQLKTAEAEWRKANPGKDPKTEDITNQAYQNFYHQAFTDSGFGTGGKVQQAIQAATAATQGLAGGDIARAAAGGAAPYIANIIGSSGLDDAGKVLAHAAVNAALAAAQGNNALVGAAGAATAEMAGLIALNAYGKPVSELSETEKQTVSALATLAAGLAGGLTGDTTADAVAAAQAGKTTVENNFLGATSSGKLDKAVEKIQQGDKSLAAANELIQLENADKRSDALVSKFTKEPSQMNSTERAELAGYLRVYAAEMEKEYGTTVSQELVKGLLSGQDYIKRVPDSEAMSKAQSIINTWGYHKSNASIGDAPLIFGSSVLGNTIREGMALNAAIGAGVNSGVQLSGNDPFSYVDMIMAGITASATTGKGIGVSAGINMGGAAIGSGIKGEDPRNAMAGAGAGTVAGGIGGTIIKGVTSKVTKETISDLTGAIGGSYLSEKTGEIVKDNLDRKERDDNKK